MNTSVKDIEQEVKELLAQEKDVSKLIIKFLEILVTKGEIPETVVRDKKIIIEYTYLRAEMKAQDARKIIAKKFNLSDIAVQRILYVPKNNYKTYCRKCENGRP